MPFFSMAFLPNFAKNVKIMNFHPNLVMRVLIVYYNPKLGWQLTGTGQYKLVIVNSLHIVNRSIFTLLIRKLVEKKVTYASIKLNNFAYCGRRIFSLMRTNAQVIGLSDLELSAFNQVVPNLLDITIAPGCILTLANRGRCLTLPQLIKINIRTAQKMPTITGSLLESEDIMSRIHY